MVSTHSRHMSAGIDHVFSAKLNTPALATATSRPPSSRAAASTAAPSASPSRTSAAMARTLPGPASSTSRSAARSSSSDESG